MNAKEYSNKTIKDEYFCRTCASKDIELLSIFDIYKDEITFDMVIKETTEIEITVDSNLPALICQECKQKAISAFEFKKRTKNVDLYLRATFHNFISSDQVIKLEEDEIIYDHEVADNSTNVDDDEQVADIKIEANETSAELQCNKCFRFYTTHMQLNRHVTANKCSKPKYDGSYLCSNKEDAGESHSIEHDDRDQTKTVSSQKVTRKVKGNAKDQKKRKTFKFTEKNQIISQNHICTICKQRFENKSTLMQHVHDHKDTPILQCLFCEKLYLKSTGLEHNCILRKLNKSDTETDVYRDATLTELPLQNVLGVIPSLKSIENIQVCCLCNEVLLSEDALETHKDSEHPELSQRCSICLKVFTTIRAAARHRINCKQVEKNFSCDSCNEKFSYEISLNKHILRCHEGQSVSVKFMDHKTQRDDKKYQCDTCKKRFNRRDTLVKHTKLHMPDGMNHECEICKKRFLRKDNLRSHKRIHEPRKEKASNSCLCLYCGRSFNNSSNLIVHMRRHTGEKPYKCDFCDKGFPRSSDLKGHRSLHTGEKPCVCRVCNKRFSRSSKLSRHMRIHTGYKPYKCTYCEKAFCQSYDLTLHIRRHTGDKPYICEVCGERFIQGNALQNHRRVHGHFTAAGPQETETLVVQSSNVTYNIQHV